MPPLVSKISELFIDCVLRWCAVADQPLGAIAEANVKAADNVHNVVRQTTSTDAVVKRLSRKSSGGSSTNGMSSSLLVSSL